MVNIIYKDEAMKKVIVDCDNLNKHAPNDSILVTGQTGTGKELIARYIHEHSSRKDKDFIALNCSAFPETLIESELFGYEKGAHSMAAGQKIGKFEMADTGTLFLDEIADLPLHLQPILLRALDGNGFYRVGGTELVKPDVRIICATHKDLWQLVQQGKFRDDFYWRIVCHIIRIPSLRERPDDIRALALGFAKERQCAIDDKAIERLLTHPLTGNVRQLKTLIARASIRALENGKVIKESDIEMVDIELKQMADNKVPNQTLADVDKRHILKVYEETNHNIAETARILDISENTVRKNTKSDN